MVHSCQVEALGLPFTLCGHSAQRPSPLWPAGLCNLSLGAETGLSAARPICTGWSTASQRNQMPTGPAPRQEAEREVRVVWGEATHRIPGGRKPSAPNYAGGIPVPGPRGDFLVPLRQGWPCILQSLSPQDSSCHAHYQNKQIYSCSLSQHCFSASQAYLHQIPKKRTIRPLSVRLVAAIVLRGAQACS